MNIGFYGLIRSNHYALSRKFFLYLVSIILTSHGSTSIQAEIHWDIQSPLDFQVFQRQSLKSGRIHIRGSITGVKSETQSLQYRLHAHKDGSWTETSPELRNGVFDCSIDAPAGGWFRLELRVVEAGKSLGEFTIQHVGVGEIFVIAGQSNAANHGEQRQHTLTAQVSTFDGTRWQMAHDPQPGASGKRGSFIPAFGDAMAQKFHVPIGIVSCGIGATSVREWLPKGSQFPNPPTLTRRVIQMANGDWESKGEAYDMFINRLRSLQDHQFRAVLWHQGESDANQKDKTRTLPGKLYRQYLEKLIRASRKAISREVPWFVALVSYHTPGDESSDEIREAQASLWHDGIALKGPDSDAIKGHYRERGGQGVHFSGEGLKKHGECWAEAVGPWLESVLKE